MPLNNKQQYQVCDKDYFKTDIGTEYIADTKKDEEEDWKRLVCYIAGIIMFFFILFKYLI